ncbi:retrovirus-related pol polyprotein from transposon TNT 1-94 [Tanacetum coccineum]
MKVEESLNVTFDETPPPSKTSPLEDDDLVEEEAIEVSKTRPLENNEIINIKESKSRPLENVIEPKNINEALKDKSWIFRNKLDENSVVSRNKARLVGQGYNQQEGIDYDETYAPVARLESIRILLAYACTLDFKLFHMDVKSAFLNGLINEEVYVAQPPGFIDFAKPNHVYRLKKALYGLKQAPKACDSCNTNVGQSSISPSINQPQTQPPFSHLLINPHVASGLHAQTPLSPQGDNHSQPPLPSSPTLGRHFRGNTRDLGSILEEIRQDGKWHKESVTEGGNSD